MISDFKKKKLLYIFTKFFDSNASGAIDKKDFDLNLETVAKLQGWSQSDAKYKEISGYLDEIWAGLQSRADADNDGQVSEEEWISMWDEFGKNPASGAEWQNLFCKMVFAVEDKSNDGAIDSEEFRNVYVAFGINADEAVQAFQKMSKGKSSISWPEFQELFNEYFATEDINAPGNYIFAKTSF